MKITNERLREITGIGQQYNLKTDEKIIMANELLAARLVARAAEAVVEDYELGLDASLQEGVIEKEEWRQGRDMAKTLRDAIDLHKDMMGVKKARKK